jgi:hypothetical protein
MSVSVLDLLVSTDNYIVRILFLKCFNYTSCCSKSVTRSRFMKVKVKTHKLHYKPKLSRVREKMNTNFPPSIRVRSTMKQKYHSCPGSRSVAILFAHFCENSFFYLTLFTSNTCIIIFVWFSIYWW